MASELGAEAFKSQNVTPQVPAPLAAVSSDIPVLGPAWDPECSKGQDLILHIHTPTADRTVNMSKKCISVI